jgi:hypothetical protein
MIAAADKLRTFREARHEPRHRTAVADAGERTGDDHPEKAPDTKGSTT